MSRDAEFNFDLERMKKAVDGPRVVIPDGMTREQLAEWIGGQAQKIREKRR